MQHFAERNGILKRTMPLNSYSKSDDADAKALQRQCISSFEAQGAIGNFINAQMEDTPPRLLNTSTGRLCDREAQIYAFKASPEYNLELLSFPVEDTDLRIQCIQDVIVAFFGCVVLSRR